MPILAKQPTDNFVVKYDTGYRLVLIVPSSIDSIIVELDISEHIAQAFISEGADFLDTSW